MQINTVDLKNDLIIRYPGCKIYVEKMGISVWIGITSEVPQYFDIQITPQDGIGVTYRTQLATTIDFDGHDIVFDHMEQALEYVDKIIRL